MLFRSRRTLQIIVARVKWGREGILRDRVPKNYDGEPVQLMSRDSPSLLPSPQLKASSITLPCFLDLMLLMSYPILTKTNCCVNSKSRPECSAFVSLSNIRTSRKLGFEYGVNGSALHLSLATFLFFLQKE